MVKKKVERLVNTEKLTVVLEKLNQVFLDEALSPFEIKVAIDVIYANINRLDDIYSRERIEKAKFVLESVKERSMRGIS